MSALREDRKYFDYCQNKPLDFRFQRCSEEDFGGRYDDYHNEYRFTGSGSRRFYEARRRQIIKNNVRAVRIIKAFCNTENNDIITKQLTNKFQQITNECNDWSSIIFKMVKFQTKEDIISKLSEEKDMAVQIYNILRSRKGHPLERELKKAIVKILDENEFPICNNYYWFSHSDLERFAYTGDEGIYSFDSMHHKYVYDLLDN